jgi:TQXA domain-containing protein/LPXTG-motif cell wall-anchored protein
MASGLKIGSGVLAAAAALMAAAVPAGADGVTGTVADGGTSGYRVNLGGAGGDPHTILFTLTLSNGGSLRVYCAEIKEKIDHAKDLMVERPWDAYPNASSPFTAQRDKLNWVLHNGFPVKDTATLASVLTGAGKTLHGGLSAKEAITATQAAAWHFSDGVDLEAAAPLKEAATKGTAEDVWALYDYLTGAQNVGLGKAPTAALEITPKEQTGRIGQRVGPFTVNTTGDVKELTTQLPAGVQLVDKDGKEIAATAIKNGTQVFVDVPAGTAPGTGTFGLSATAPVATGRLFVAGNYADHPAQTVIVATAESTTLTAGAKATWTATAPATTTTPAAQASAGPALADTGASIFVPALLGLVLLGAGGAALLFLRRRGNA